MAGRQAQKRTVLIVDDSRVTIHMLQDAFTVLGCESVLFTSPAEGLAWLERNTPELALFDVHMPGISGLTLLEQVRERGGRFPVVLMTAHPTEQLDRRAAELGATDVLAKPVSVDTLQNLLEHVARVRKGMAPEPEPELEPEDAARPEGDSPAPATPGETRRASADAADAARNDYLARVEHAVQAARRWVERCDGYRRAQTSGDWSAAELNEMLNGCATTEHELVTRLIEMGEP